MRLGFIGAGRMGRPMVTRLLEAGHEVRVVGRSEEKRRELSDAGAVAVPSAGDAAEGAEVVLLCVFDDAQVREVCLEGDLPARMPTGSTLVTHTTGSPRTLREIEARAGRRGIGVADAPVSGGPHDIAAGRVTLFVGGAEETVARATPALSAYGDPVLHLGPLGSGQRVKLINNVLFAAHIGLLAEAARLAKQFGVTEDALLKALPHGSSDSRALRGVAARGSVAEFLQTVAGFLGKDVAVAREVAAELDGDLGAIGTAIDAAG